MYALRRDLKSFGRNTVPVRLRPRAPFKINNISLNRHQLLWLSFLWCNSGVTFNRRLTSNALAYAHLKDQHFPIQQWATANIRSE